MKEVIENGRERKVIAYKYTDKNILKRFVSEKATSCLFRNGTIRFGNEKFSFTI